WFYLYRAIDSAGATIDFFLSAFRSAAAAKALLAKGLADPSHPQPRVINTDKAKCYPSAVDESKGEGVLRKRCRHRPVQYLNNILEQDHRAIKKRIRAKQHFRQFGCARRTIQGYEVIHKTRKGQVRWVKKGDVLAQNQFIDRVLASPPELAALSRRSRRCLDRLQSLQHILQKRLANKNCRVVDENVDFAKFPKCLDCEVF